MGKILKPEKKYDIDNIPVYYGKFSEALTRIRLILKDYQHELQVSQKESNGQTTSVEVLIRLFK